MNAAHVGLWIRNINYLLTRYGLPKHPKLGIRCRVPFKFKGGLSGCKVQSSGAREYGGAPIEAPGLRVGAPFFHNPQSL